MNLDMIESVYLIRSISILAWTIVVIGVVSGVFAFVSGMAEIEQSRRKERRTCLALLWLVYALITLILIPHVCHFGVHSWKIANDRDATDYTLFQNEDQK